MINTKGYNVKHLKKSKFTLEVKEFVATMNYSWYYIFIVGDVNNLNISKLTRYGVTRLDPWQIDRNYPPGTYFGWVIKEKPTEETMKRLYEILNLCN